MSSNKQPQRPAKGKPNPTKRRPKNNDPKGNNTARGKPRPKNPNQNQAKSNYRPPNKDYQNRKNFTLKINPNMKKPRAVSPRFITSRDNLIKLFKPHDIADDDNWSHSKGEGMKYVDLLRLPFYDDEQKLPENIVKTKDGFQTNLERLDWDVYFDAIQKNFEFGFVPKYQSMKKPKMPNNNQPEDSKGYHNKFYDNDVEWDEVPNSNVEAQTKAPAKTTKYQVQLKQISDDERSQIMKQIEQQESTNKPGKPISIEELESQLVKPNTNAKPIQISQKPLDIANIEQKLSKTSINTDIKGNNIEHMFDEDDANLDNILIKSKENQDDDDDGDLEFAQVDVSQIKKGGDQLPIRNLTPSEDLVKEPKPELKLKDKVSPEQPENVDISKPQKPEEPLKPEETESTELPQDIEEVEGEDEAEGDNEPQKSTQEEEITPEQQYMLYQQYKAFQEQSMNQSQNQSVNHGQSVNSSYVSQNQSYSNTSASSAYPEPAVGQNPFDNILKTNSTSQWFYKDPHGQIRGSFTSFDMHTWYNEGYFNEDLEISIDAQNFLRLKDLRLLTKDDQTPSFPQVSNNNSQYSQPQQYQNVYKDPQMMSGHQDMGHMPEQYQNYMYGQQQMPQNMGYNNMHMQQDMQSQIAYQNYIQQQQQQQMSYQGHPSGQYWP